MLLQGAGVKRSEIVEHFADGVGHSVVNDKLVKHMPADPGGMNAKQWKWTGR